MDKIDDGGPAFPTEQPVEFISDGRSIPLPHRYAFVGGMSLRDHYAALALVHFSSFISMKHSASTAKIIAALCYDMADAMIAERKKRNS